MNTLVKYLVLHRQSVVARCNTLDEANAVILQWERDEGAEQGLHGRKGDATWREYNARQIARGPRAGEHGGTDLRIAVLVEHAHTRGDIHTAYADGVELGLAWRHRRDLLDTHAAVSVRIPGALSRLKDSKIARAAIATSGSRPTKIRASRACESWSNDLSLQ